MSTDDRRPPPCWVFPADHDDPFEPPERRYLRCRYLLEKGLQPLPTRDDDLTRQAWRYLHGVERGTAADRQALDRAFPAVAAAYHFYRTADSLSQAEVEARLLGREDNATISRKCGLSPSAVAAYHGIFFNVRTKLEAESYITNVVLGTKVHDGVTPEDRELILKTFGYGLGGRVVDQALAYFRSPPVVPASLASLTDAALQELQSKLHVEAMIRAFTFRVQGVHPAKVSAVFDGLKGVTRSPDLQPVVLRPVRATTQVLWSGLAKDLAAPPAPTDPGAAHNGSPTLSTPSTATCDAGAHSPLDRPTRCRGRKLTRTRRPKPQLVPA
jgi:hypothetical protein